MALDQQDWHFMHLARNGTNAANPEFLELICIIVFHVSKYFLHFSVGLGSRLDGVVGFGLRVLSLSFSAFVRRRQFKTRLSRGPRARATTVAIVSSSTSASTGLGRYAVAPFSMALSQASGVCNPVIITTGTWAPVCVNRDWTSKPFICGMSWSRTTQCGA